MSFQRSTTHTSILALTAVMMIILTLSLTSQNGGGVDAFVSSPHSAAVRSTFTTPSFQCKSKSPVSSSSCSPSSSQLNFFSGYEMGGTDAVNNERKNKSGNTGRTTSKNNKDEAANTAGSLDETEDPLFLASLITKGIIILIIKTAKDIVNYPPNLLDQYNRYQQMRNQEIANNNSNIQLQQQQAEEKEKEKELEDPAMVMSAKMEPTESDTDTTTTSTPTTATTTTPSPYMPLPIELTKTNPFILLAKFVGVLTYKTMHDAIYYPALWINDFLHPPHNDDDAYYYY
ncbi:unnamed protein product [Cylindrotheca closterium]|uniref:Uncharacterized protein n=1 Tax=Cylindrotheca closterium TaxID=2856 RepID=A0AAD2FHB3_9STRA|nr:unnamed protein product [Cylindrotheca closterium]